MRIATLFLLCCLLSAQAFAQAAYRRVKARNGDGVETLLLRHGLSPGRYGAAFRQLNKKNLTRRNGLITGRTYLLPRPVAARKAPTRARTARTATAATAAPEVLGKNPISKAVLFGPRYGAPAARYGTLRGAVYYLSSGHGGPDPGAIGKYGSFQLAEDEYAYDVTVRLARVLLEHGATVYVMVQDPNDGIRDANVLPMDYDEVQHPNKRIPLSQVQRLRQRIAEVNRLHGRHKGAYQRLLALHVDSRSEGQNIDVFFYHHANSPTGERLARSIHQVFTTRYKRAQPNRPYSGNVSERSNLYEVRNSHAPAVFMELGNIRNQKDQRRFVVPDNRQALANWICEGLIADYRSKK
ncbi:N-acetylmuramoyl-L-alanine amidase [Hymenobacter sp. BT635]|uniref:N-acetylmuramoyl-L-alanine amidase n=1 Tax=Hymenobacter nitidus TaxID=2880929 RepID=A0ABS8AAQ5_9BACT|nr:N-acetylmuramoyl-L-alanine amidase [Hymenobacter nitidus]MCB2377488.1 N-acetylmuramoyl-L-alanine amidase [Hymenobacter nitidus]